jgi:hypothetical protein
MIKELGRGIFEANLNEGIAICLGLATTVALAPLLVEGLYVATMDQLTDHLRFQLRTPMALEIQ